MGTVQAENARTLPVRAFCFQTTDFDAAPYFLSRVVTNLDFAGKINSIFNHTLLYV
jgi:hypothetical protein